MREFSGSDADWDRLTVNLESASPYQSSGWASFRARSGWSHLRLISRSQRGAVQFLTKSSAISRILWAPGGPIGQMEYDDFESLSQVIDEIAGRKMQYVRVSDHRPANSTLLNYYEQTRWHRPKHPFATGETLRRNLSRDISSLRQEYTKNWSRNLQRRASRNLRIETWGVSCATEIAHLQQSVVKHKHLRKDWRTDEGSIVELMKCFGDSLILIGARSASGEPLAVRGAVLIGKLGFDLLASTSQQGRRVYASNVVTDSLLQVLSERDIQSYDFGGVDRRRNRGVYDFKHGAGGKEHHYLGEFERSAPGWLRFAIHPYLSTRKPD